MKKVILTVLVVGLFVAAVAVPPAWSQGKKVNLSLNVGVQTDIFNGTSFDKALFTLDARAGIKLGGPFEISPEVMVVFSYLTMFGGSGGTLVYPGAMLNYRNGNFFVGAGAVLPWAFFEGSSDTGSLAPKINIGYTFGNNIQITAYYLCWTDDPIKLFDAGFAGVTLGYKF
jgi:hypothetical protein